MIRHPSRPPSAATPGGKVASAKASAQYDGSLSLAQPNIDALNPGQGSYVRASVLRAAHI